MKPEGWIDRTFRRLVNIQYDQQRLIHGPRPQGRDEQRRLGHAYAQHAVGELYGYLEAARYKDFFPGRELPRSTRLIELVDAFKLILATAWAEGFTPQEIEEAFIAKTATVSARWKQRNIGGERICTVDMDGVLCQYEWPWTPSEAEFIERGGILEIPPIEGAKETLEWLKDAGWTVVILTARKRWLHQRVDNDTRGWLTKHGFPHDAVIYASDKGEAIKQLPVPIAFHVDDSIKHALDVTNVVGRSYLMRQAATIVDDHTSIRSTLVQVVDHKALRADLEETYDQSRL